MMGCVIVSQFKSLQDHNSTLIAPKVCNNCKNFVNSEFIYSNLPLHVLLYLLFYTAKHVFNDQII